ncbi:2'-5'-oligoadenylate synthase 1A-like [Gigantopelta aegis]|uniref:2'-5'-oligoadenylate synthase 1A-like n=1 Tax=Gigantopelta aegis TaxID=1735272 RepID=UPI001B88A205|nr:2'-5'-oligoadenylate synthase 1A-like [Gigantopelta aegis]XP_041370392.1 2'-5'-oligoadenylate synthase 1A-like [Gigantopelta aegis]
MGVSQSRYSNESSGPRRLLDDIRSGETLNQYIERIVQPDTAYLEKCNRTVDKLVRFLHEKLTPALRRLSSHQLRNVNVKEILKSGSLGKSTAVRNKSDIDLILFLNGIETVENLRDLMPTILRCLRELLNELVRSPNYPWARSIRYKKDSKFAICCILTTTDDYGNEDEREVDLLPAVDITHSESLRRIYDKMDSTDEDSRRYYSACLSRMQREFVQNATASAKVKDLIRLVKIWAKDRQVPIRSYFVELLVIYNQRRHPAQDFEIPDHVKEILVLLSECESMRIVFTDKYNPRNYRNTMNKDQPYLLCPANPFMNTAPSPADARIVARKAREVLPIFS